MVADSKKICMVTARGNKKHDVSMRTWQLDRSSIIKVAYDCFELSILAFGIKLSPLVSFFFFIKKMHKFVLSQKNLNQLNR